MSFDPTYPIQTEQERDITRLRAEVKRLTNQYEADGRHIQAAEDRIEELKRERDEALAHIKKLETELEKARA